MPLKSVFFEIYCLMNPHMFTTALFPMKNTDARNTLMLFALHENTTRAMRRSWERPNFHGLHGQYPLALEYGQGMMPYKKITSPFSSLSANAFSDFSPCRCIRQTAILYRIIHLAEA